MLKVSTKEMQDVLQALFEKHGFTEENARLLAEVHTENTLYGINSHGINRVPRFINYVKRGTVKINMGLVALRNTNHWMRGGYYGWQAANENCISILFTNTQPNMPAWGAKESRIGNNPLVVSIPRAEGHVVLDMALSQFSFGKINEYKLKGEQLPYPGGWDEEDQLSTDPEKILKKERGLPIGYWKGSAFSIVLDMLATLLSAGNSTYRVGLEEHETAISQVFLCIYPEVFHDKDLQQSLINEIIDYTHDATPIAEGQRTYYPGEQSKKAMQRNTENGMQVDEKVWQSVLDLLG